MAPSCLSNIASIVNFPPLRNLTLYNCEVTHRDIPALFGKIVNTLEVVSLQSIVFSSATTSSMREHLALLRSGSILDFKLDSWFAGECEIVFIGDVGTSNCTVDDSVADGAVVALAYHGEDSVREGLRRMLECVAII